MSKEKILDYYIKEGLMDDHDFVYLHVSGDLIERVIRETEHHSSLVTNVNSFERRQIHLICEALGYFSCRETWIDEKKYVCLSQCNGCTAASTRVGVRISREHLELDTRKSRSHKKMRAIERRSQQKKYSPHK